MVFHSGSVVVDFNTCFGSLEMQIFLLQQEVCVAAAFVQRAVVPAGYGFGVAVLVHGGLGARGDETPEIRHNLWGIVGV